MSKNLSLLIYNLQD